MKIKVTWLFLILTAVGFGSPAEEVGIKAADAQFQLRKSDDAARAALDAYRKLRLEFPKNSEVGWRLAMACEFVGHRITPDTEPRRLLFKEGRDAGLETVEQSPDCAPCHFWTAINMALYGDSVGAFKTFVSLPQIRKLLARSIELDPNYAWGGAYRVLGLIEQKLPGILGGSDRRAEEYFRQAIGVAAQEPLNILTLAQHLIEHRDNLDGGIAVLKKGVLEARASDGVPESEESISELNSYYQKWVPRLTARP